MIPVFDIKRQNFNLKKEFELAMSQVIGSGIFILGQNVSQFEEEFAKYIGVKYAVGVASGTDAITLSLLSLGIGEGDEVILPANAYPSAFALTQIGVIPKLVDIDPDTYNIDPEKIPQAINKKTKAIIPVHLYGQPANLKAILEIGKKYNLPIIEDCAQAHGAEISIRSVVSSQQNNVKLRTENRSLTTFKKKVGSLGDVGCFSFYPTKNLGCFGDGGMVVTNNKSIYEKVKLLRMYGEKRRYESVVLGRNSRLDELQAAILLVKLKYLDTWNDKRRIIADRYLKEFAEVGMNFLPCLPAGRRTSQIGVGGPARKLSLPANSINIYHVYHLFVIRTTKRDQLKEYLEKKGIQSAIHYPVPIHLVPSFGYLGYRRGDFLESERACKEILSLPMYPELKDNEVDIVIKAIFEFYDK